MIKADRYLLETLKEIQLSGCIDQNPRPKYKDGEEAYSKFITQVVFQYNLDRGEFPIPTLRKTAIKKGIEEIIWIYLKQSNKLSDAPKWWADWDIGDGTIGVRYAETVKRHNIINSLLYNLEHHPYDRGHIINLFQYQDFKESKGLRPCAFLSMFSVRGEYIDLTLTLRSSDFVMAGFINQIQYVALLLMICGHLKYHTGIEYKPGNFMCVIQNCHTYLRHENAVKELIERTPLNIQPKIELKEAKNFYDYTVDDFLISGVSGIKDLSIKLELAI